MLMGERLRIQSLNVVGVGLVAAGCLYGMVDLRSAAIKEHSRPAVENHAIANGARRTAVARKGPRAAGRRDQRLGSGSESR